MENFLKALVTGAITLSLVFLQAFLGFKLYTWFGPETGIDLPELTYLNIFAIIFVLSAFRIKLDSSYKLTQMYEKLVEDKQDSLLRAISKALYYFVALGLSYLYYIIIF